MLSQSVASAAKGLCALGSKEVGYLGFGVLSFGAIAPNGLHQGGFPVQMAGLSCALGVFFPRPVVSTCLGCQACSQGTSLKVLKRFLKGFLRV